MQCCAILCNYAYLRILDFIITTRTVIKNTGDKYAISTHFTTLFQLTG